MGLIFLSAFYSLAFQIHGLIGERGILPAHDYLVNVAAAEPGLARFWYVPSVLWAASSDRALTILVGCGILCSLLLVANVWPKGSVALATLLFLSCVTTLQEFSSYQSDGMLLQAGFVSVFFAPRGIRPGLGATHPPSRASLFLLRWECFCIYFESGVAKLASGDPHWRNLTAMDEYYQNGPLPAWPGWYVQHLPQAFHAATALVTLVMELVVVWAMFGPRPFRRACFAAMTLLQLGIIATANYAFLNYLVLVLGVLLLDDAAFEFRRHPERTERSRRGESDSSVVPLPQNDSRGESDSSVVSLPQNDDLPVSRWRWIEVGVLGWILYATVVAFLGPGSGLLPAAPERALEPFRIANPYGLFATMTEARYEIEFQGSRDDGVTWIPYQFRYKPQDLNERPGIYAPYQPRFEWNLWFASLAEWRSSPWVVAAQQRLIEGSPSVLALFRRDPFSGTPPTRVRTVLWQYWFTDRATKHATGAWWRRKELGLFSGVLIKQADGRLVLTDSP